MTNAANLDGHAERSDAEIEIDRVDGVTVAEMTLTAVARATVKVESWMLVGATGATQTRHDPAQRRKCCCDIDRKDVLQPMGERRQVLRGEYRQGRVA
jgi:hypothetical protein